MAARRKVPARPRKPRWLTAAIAGGGVVLLAAAIVMASREPAPAPVDDPAEVEAETMTSGEGRLPARPVLRPAQPRAASAGDAVAPRATSGSPSATRTADEGSGAGAAEAAMTTLTGCLERHDDTYRLKDTDGADAPKSRSWKSGFLRRSSAKVEVLDPSRRLRLENHVGRRVAVSGSLQDRELQARSVQRIAASCDR